MYGSKNLVLRQCTVAAGFASSLLFAGIAQAQDSANIEQVVVTGSRIARDGYASYGLELAGGQGEIFISVKNLFDTDPELVAYPLNQGSENRAGYQPANRLLSDVLGRNFRVGMRYEF